MINQNNNFIIIDNNGFISENSELKLDERYRWININNPNQIIDIFNIHPITKEDILDNSKNVREKIEIFDNYIYIILKNINKENVNILLYDNFILTINHINLKDINSIVKRCNNNFNLDIIFYTFIDYLIDSFILITHNLSKNIDELDYNIVTDITLDKKNHKNKISKINELKKITNFYYNTIAIKKDIINQLTNKNFISNDNIIVMYDRLSTCKENIIQCQNTYTSLLSLEAAISSEKTNLIMKQLNLVATIMLPMTVIVGLFGMNVKVPGQNYNNLVWFYSISGILLLIVIILFILFRKWKYF